MYDFSYEESYNSIVSTLLGRHVPEHDEGDESVPCSLERVGAL